MPIKSEHESLRGTFTHPAIPAFEGRVMSVGERLALVATSHGTITLVSEEWEFTPEKRQLPVGWYSSLEFSVVDGYAPIYVDGEGRAWLIQPVQGEVSVVPYDGSEETLLPLAVPDA